MAFIIDRICCYCTVTNVGKKAIGAAQDAARMDRVVNFYARLPRGAAPETKATGLLGRYQARYFHGKNASAARKLTQPWTQCWDIC